MNNVVLFTWSGPSSGMESFRTAMTSLCERVSHDTGIKCTYSLEPLKADAGYNWVVLDIPGLSAEYTERVLKILSKKGKRLSGIDEPHFGKPTVVTREVYDKILAYDPVHKSEWSELALSKENTIEKLIALATGQK